MIAIFSNNMVMDDIIHRCEFSVPYVLHHDMTAFVSDPIETKLAFVNHINNYQKPESQQQLIEWTKDGAKFSSEIATARAVSKMVVAFDNEFHDYHWNIIEQNRASNLHWVLPVHMNAPVTNVITDTVQFFISTQFYTRNLAHLLERLQPFAVKPYAFDALLGNRRTHRDFVYNAVNNSEDEIQKKIMLTYTGYVPRDAKNFEKIFIREPEIEFLEPTNSSEKYVSYFGEHLPLSKVVPISIYNQCAYSIVAETSCDNRISFYTEKVIKPLLARRLFVVFSGVHFLRNLKRLGFKTFDTVIDESYDDIEDDQQRWSAAYQQVIKLCKLDQSWVYSQIKNTVEHNYQLTVNTEWRNAASSVKNLCQDLI